MFRPRVALASLSGQSDATWAKHGAPYAGAAFLGGIAIDDPARSAARDMVTDRDREEFLPTNPFDFIEHEFQSLTETPLRPGINVRSTTPEPVRRVAEICHRHNAILEVNAHCRQDELCDVGCGESLLADTDRLLTQVSAAASTGAPVSVKVRAEVSNVSLPTVATAVFTAGADCLHVDAMDSEPVIQSITDHADEELFIIANNGVRDRASAYEYLRYGADAVSLGRPSDRPAVLQRVNDAVAEWFQVQGELI